MYTCWQWSWKMVNSCTNIVTVITTTPTEHRTTHNWSCTIRPHSSSCTIGTCNDIHVVCFSKLFATVCIQKLVWIAFVKCREHRMKTNKLLDTQQFYNYHINTLIKTFTIWQSANTNISMSILFSASVATLNLLVGLILLTSHKPTIS